MFYAEKDGSVPAQEFLDACPMSPRQMLLAIIVAVTDGPPPSFPPSMHWHIMRKEMSGLYEARDRHGNTLYRLFCVLDRNAAEHGLDGPALVVLSGGAKAVREEMDARTYVAARRQREEYMASSPRRIAV